jgi:predicted RNA-binding protein YlqC (UPF0109 family)
MTDYAELALFITRKIVNDPDAVAVRVRTWAS